MKSKPRQKYYPNNLSDEYSPSIPYDFPKQNLPKEICEQQFIQLLKCGQSTDFVMECDKEYEDFFQCKKQRDLKIFDSIKVWEINKLIQMNKIDQEIYIKNLKTKQEELIMIKKKIPDAFAYENKKWRFQSDIDQIDWRISYLKSQLK